MTTRSKTSKEEIEKAYEAALANPSHKSGKRATSTPISQPHAPSAPPELNNIIQDIPSLNQSFASSSSVNATSDTENNESRSSYLSGHEDTVLPYDIGDSSDRLTSYLLNVNMTETAKPTPDFVPFSSVKIVLDVVPFFDGTNSTVEQFIEGCELAKTLTPPQSESYLVRVIRTKLSGEARRALLDTEFETVSQLTAYLKSLFAKVKPVYQLHGELAGIYQRENEGIIAYSNRIKELGKEILESHRISRGGIDARYQAELEEDLRQCFIRGLKPGIQQRLDRTRINVKETIHEALRVETELRQISNLRKEVPTGTTCQMCHESGHTALNCQLIPPADKPSSGKDILVCQYCKKRGHSADKCRSIGKTNQRPVKVVQSDPNVCRICQNPGHFARECRSPRAQTCQICGKTGHSAKDCYQRQDNNARGSANEVCQWCRRRGHRALECRLRQGSQNTPSNTTVLCQICNKAGHDARACRSGNNQNHNNNDNQGSNNRAATNAPIQCRYCKEEGHVLENCQKRIESNRKNQGNFNGPSTTGATRGGNTNSRPAKTITTDPLSFNLSE